MKRGSRKTRRGGEREDADADQVGSASHAPLHRLAEEAGRPDEQDDEDDQQRHRQPQVGADEVDVRRRSG